MLCQNCHRRDRCVEPCPRLEDDLQAHEGAVQELIYDPESVAHLADISLFSLADLQPGQPWPWENLTRFFPYLSAAQVELFISRFFDHRGVAEIAAERGVHRVTVSRQLHEAVAVIREARERSAARVEGRYEGMKS